MFGLVKNREHLRWQKEKLNKLDIENITANFIFTLCSASTFGIFKKIINSIGSQKLTKTFDDIETKHPFNSVKIINAGIRLDHLNGFQFDAIQSLKKENEKNPLGFSAIQNLVMDYLHMYEVPYNKKQQICDLLNIKLKDQLVIGAFVSASFVA